jgi:hypothetical protein
MSLSNAAENSILALIFTATTWTNIAINATSSPLTNIHTALATADPGEAGTMSTSETAYTSYARVNVARSGAGFTVTANSVSPGAAITFPAGSGGGDTVSHFSWGYTGGGAVAIIISGTVTPNISTGSGITPQLTTASAATLD